MADQYVDRWHPREVDSWLTSPFGHTEAGLQDWRGIPLSKLDALEGLEVCEGDFSSGNLSQLRVSKCAFRGCVFDGSNLQRVIIRSCKFEECRFRRTDLRFAQIGTSGSSFDRCIFEKVRVTRAGFHNPVFREMKFWGKDWGNVDFGASGFWDCVFSGAIRGVTFRGDYQFPGQREMNGIPEGTGLHDVSFEDAELHWVGFTNGCALDHIILPRSGSSFLCRNDVLIECESWLKLEFPKLQGIEKFFEIIRVHASLQTERLVSEHDIGYFCGPENGHEIYVALKGRIAHASVLG